MKPLLALLTFALAATTIAEEILIPEQQRTTMKEAAAFRTFTANDDEFSGRPTGFIKETGSVEFKLADGSERTALLATLSEKDKEFVKDWLTGYSLLTNNQIQFTIRKKTTRRSHIPATACR